MKRKDDFILVDDVMKRSNYDSIRKITFKSLVLRKLLTVIIRVIGLGNSFRVFLYQLMGVNILGSDTYIGRDCYIDEEYPELITINNRVVISFRVLVIAHDYSRNIVAPVRLEEGAFIGAGAILLPGVIIGHHSVVAAGAVVTRDVPSNTMVAGIPAKMIKQMAPSD